MTDGDPLSMDRIRALIENWRSKASEAHEQFDHESAYALERCADELEALVRSPRVPEAERTQEGLRRDLELQADYDRAVEALKAAAQFLDPEINRGPSSYGWANTRAFVDEVLADAAALSPIREDTDE